MGIFSTSSPFDQDVERATSENNTNEEWGLIMEICDRAGASAQSSKECLRAVLRRLAHPDPHVQVHAATLLDACVANCGRLFHLEVASRDFETEYRRLLARAQPPVAARLRALLRKWAEGEFRDDPQLDLIPSLHARLRAETPGADVAAAGTGSGPAAAAGPTAASAAAQRERDELARAIALSLRESAGGAGIGGGGAGGASAGAGGAGSAAPLYPRVEAPEPAPPSSRMVRALYDFEAAEDNELTFFAGEIVHVTDSSDPNWWKGHNERGEGLFPANFVTEETAVPAEGRRETPEPRPDEPLAGAGPPRIDEPALDEALALLHEADPTAPAGADEARLARLEQRAHASGALVDAALERADRRHARLTQLSAELVDALNLYHSLMREPLKAPFAGPAPPAPPGPPAPPPAPLGYAPLGYGAAPAPAAAPPAPRC